MSIADVSDVKIHGAGIGKTIIKNGGIGKNSVTPTYRVEIEDLTIDVNGKSVNALNLTQNSYDFRIKRVELKNTADKFLLHWCVERADKPVHVKHLLF